MRQALEAGERVSIKPDGESMLPFIRPKRDVVVLSRLPEQLKKYDLVLYRRDNGKFVLHRVVKVGDTYSCVGDNQFALEYGVRREQMIAVATAVIRNGRERSVDLLPYRVYYRFRYYTRRLRQVVTCPGYFLRRIFSCLRSKH